MGLCASCRKSKDRDRIRGHCGNNKEFVGFLSCKISKICNHIPKVAISHEAKCLGCLNGQTIGSPHTEAMAASFPNMNLTNPIKGLVSKKRNRYKGDGFNLDLSYITNNIIAMGYPASNIESVYRNNIDDVVKFLDKKHPEHYRIYNLCSERSYDKSKFHDNVIQFPFDDHCPPKIEIIENFCKDVDEWLKKHSNNIAVVHCKAGKGRTGTMICCYLLHSRKFSSAADALRHYGEKRTEDMKGVTIPSQVRYVEYYEQLVNRQLIYKPVTVSVRKFFLEPIPTDIWGQGLSFTVSDNNLTPTIKSETYKIPVDAKSFSIKLDRHSNNLTGDVKIEFYNKVMMRKEKLFHFWFNTFFVEVMCSAGVNGYDEECGPNGEDFLTIEFKKHELDKLSKKDKQHKLFSENFKLTMIIQKAVNQNSTGMSNHPNRSNHHRIHGQDLDHDSTSSETSSESAASDWDSVDGTVIWRSSDVEIEFCKTQVGSAGVNAFSFNSL